MRRLRRATVACIAAVAGSAQVVAGLSAHPTPLQIVCLALTAAGGGIVAGWSLSQPSAPAPVPPPLHQEVPGAFELPSPRPVEVAGEVMAGAAPAGLKKNSPLLLCSRLLRGGTTHSGPALVAV